MRRLTLCMLLAFAVPTVSSVGVALGTLHSGDTPEVQRARQALSDAESRRNSAEGDAIAAVSAELSARAGRLIADLQRNTEAAQFGVASAAFFRAIDETRQSNSSQNAARIGCLFLEVMPMSRLLMEKMSLARSSNNTQRYKMK